MKRGIPGRLFAHTVVLGALAVAPASAHAYTFRSTADGTPVRWGEGAIELRVDPALCGAAEVSERVAGDAAGAWGASADAPRIVVGGLTASTPGYRGDPSDENGVYLVRDWAYGPALAVTITTSRALDGVILDTDVLVSQRADLVVGSAASPSTFDLQSVLTHELGHVLGLGESEVVGATMDPAQKRGSIEGRSIHADDVDGLAELYALPAGRLAASGCAAGGRSGGSLVALVGLGIAASLGRARRRRRIAVIAASVALVALLGAFSEDVGSREAEVIAIEVEDRGGLFVTVAQVITETGEIEVVEIPGGTRDGIVQHVSHLEAPRVGDRVAVSPAGR